MNIFKAQILTPDGPVFEGEVVSVRLPGSSGDFEILHNHANIMSSLEIGAVAVQKESNSEEIFAISGGFVEVSDNQLVLLAEAAEQASGIDVARAQAAKERAEKRLLEPDVDKERAKKALRRALNRILIANRN